MLKYLITIVFLLNTGNNLYPLNEPEQPSDPSVDFKFDDPNIKVYPVEIIRKDKNKTSGNIYLRLTNISFTCQGVKIYVKIEDISSIEFLEWMMDADKENTFIFYPSKILLKLKNDQHYITERLSEFNKIKFYRNSQNYNLYAYFYDYLKNGKWNNSGADGKVSITNNPLPGTLIKIIFKEDINPVNKFLKVITR